MPNSERRQAFAVAAVQDMEAKGATPGEVINALSEAMGMMLATVSPDAGGLERNLALYAEQTERFSRACFLEKGRL